MAKTDLGCEVLQDKGHFADFAHFIRRHGLESEDQDLILKLKSILWAVVRHLPPLYSARYLIGFRAISVLPNVACLSWRRKRSSRPFWRSQNSRWCSLFEGKYLSELYS